jgi:hypothetical protein
LLRAVLSSAAQLPAALAGQPAFCGRQKYVRRAGFTLRTARQCVVIQASTGLRAWPADRMAR